MSEWQYWQTTLSGDSADYQVYNEAKKRWETGPNWLQRADDAANAHFAEMAQAGWELVTTTATTFVNGGTRAHHFIWKRHV